MKLIMMVSFCDAMGSMGTMMGYPNDYGPCVAQGAMIFFFYRASWLWTTSISFSLYCQVMYGRLLLTFTTISIIVWGISIILEILPIANGLTYGNCYRFAPTLPTATTFGTLAVVGDDSVQSKFKYWVSVTFVFPLAANLISMILCHLFIHLRVVPALKLSASVTSNRILRCLSTAQVYPLLMLVCWVPHVTIFMLVNNVPSLDSKAYLLIQFSFLWGALQGFYLFVLYFYRSHDSRRLWSLYFYREKSSYYKYNKNTIADIGRSSSMSTVNVAIFAPAGSGAGADSLGARPSPEPDSAADGAASRSSKGSGMVSTAQSFVTSKRENSMGFRFGGISEGRAEDEEESVEAQVVNIGNDYDYDEVYYEQPDGNWADVVVNNSVPSTPLPTHSPLQSGRESNASVSGKRSSFIEMGSVATDVIAEDSNA